MLKFAKTKGENLMRFYSNAHPYCCGIDLHARLIYVFIGDDKSDVLVLKRLKDDNDALK